MTNVSARNSLPRGRGGPGAVHGRPGWITEFNNLDENMTSQLLSIQQQALQMAMVAQKIEDEQNAVLGHTGKIIDQNCDSANKILEKTERTIFSTLPMVRHPS